MTPEYQTFTSTAVINKAMLFKASGLLSFYIAAAETKIIGPEILECCHNKYQNISYSLLLDHGSTRRVLKCMLEESKIAVKETVKVIMVRIFMRI